MKNKVIIELNKKEDYVNKFNNKRISSDLNNYIIEETKTLDLKKNIIIEIAHRFKLSEEEKEELIKMIKLSYKDDFEELLTYEKKIINKALVLLLFGTFILSINYFINTRFLFGEFILIIGWLMIWEGANGLLFSRTENKVKQTRRNQLIHSTIQFKDTSKINK